MPEAPIVMGIPIFSSSLSMLPRLVGVSGSETASSG